MFALLRIHRLRVNCYMILNTTLIMHNGIFDSCKSPLSQPLRLIHTPLFARETLQTAHAPSLGISATGGSAAWRHRNSCFMITAAYRTYIMCRMDIPYAYTVFYISNSLYGRICSSQDILPWRNLCWNFRTIYGGYEPIRNRVVVPARQGYKGCGIDSL